MANYTTIIGLEVHVQLLTNTKLFCSCPNRFNPDNPNVQTCPVCLGLPGALPVLNREAFKLSLKTAMSLNLELARFTKWDRKQYYYPDLPKGYQTSQFDLPFSSKGYVEFDMPSGELKRVRLIRAHLEEDAGKNIHDESGRGADSQVDLNRAGTPLLEIVSEPDIRSAEEARLYLEELRLLLLTIGVSDCNMQEGSLRCDANVNLHIHENGETIPTPIVEIKNLNSFRFLEAAIEYEVKRQLGQWEKERKRLGDVDAPKTTRGFDPDRGITILQRGKEGAADYRYFPCPDLVPVVVSEEELAAIRSTLVEFPSARRRRYRDQLGLSAYDAQVIVNQGNEFADYYDAVVAICGDGKLAANWTTQDVLRQTNDRRQTLGEFPVTAEILGTLLSKVAKNELTIKAARDVFAALLAEADEEKPISKERIDAIVAEKGLATVSDTGAIEAVINAVIARNEKAAADVRAGKQQALGPLVGQVMKELKGADAKVVRQLLIDKLSS